MTKKLPVISSSELAYHDEFSGFLGAGGFGSVRRATWGANKQVAVKILFNLQPTQTPITKISEDTSFPKINTYILKVPEIYLSGGSLCSVELDEFQKRRLMLLAEARAMNEMEHERIIPLLGFVEDSASIVMEYMEHGSLKVFIKNNQNMQWKLRHILLLDIAEGMEYLHSKTTADGQPKAILFHQDLKTDNVLLGIEYGELRAKISDFGFASLRKANMGRSKILSEVSNVTHKGGTMVYTAPELFQSDRFTRECDVYSFGVILLELITLFPPQYAIRDFHIYLQSIQKKAPEFPSFFLSMAVNSLHFTNPKARPSFSEIRRTLSNHQREVQECNIDQDHLKVILLKSSCTGASPTKMSASVQDMSSVFSFFSSKYRTARSDATNTAGSKKYFRVTILVCIVAAVIAIIIILILMFGGKTSTSSSTAYSNSSSSMSAFSAPSITATPTSTPLANQGATGLWGGVNSPLLFTMSDADQSEWVIKLHAANIKVIRVIIKSSFSNNAIPDLEPTSIGIYNDTILQRIDNLMVKTVSVGIKLIIAIHDRLMLGCNGEQDIYGSYLGLDATGIYGGTDNCNDASAFYLNGTATAAYDARIKHVLNFASPNFNNQPWSGLSHAIYSFDIQNFAQLGSGSKNLNHTWWCDRAMQMKHLVRNGVLVSSGPPNNNADMVNNNIDCIAIDVVSLDAGNLNVFTSVFGGYRSSASLSSKTIVIESFKPFQYYSSSRSLGITAVCSVANSLSIPWIVWQVSNDTSADPTAFSWTSDPSAWTALSLQAGNTTSNSA